MTEETIPTTPPETLPISKEWYIRVDDATPSQDNGRITWLDGLELDEHGCHPGVCGTRGHENSEQPCYGGLSYEDTPEGMALAQAIVALLTASVAHSTAQGNKGAHTLTFRAVLAEPIVTDRMNEDYRNRNKAQPRSPMDLLRALGIDPADLDRTTECKTPAENIDNADSN